MDLFKKNDGAITVYMAIILSIMLILTGVLVDGARARVAQAQVQSATEAAANSLIANYNNILKEWFGLMAMSENNPSVLEETLRYYLNRNLMTELGAEKPSLGDQSWNYLKKYLNSSNEYENVKFLNMYDYLLEEVSVLPLYNLSESEVLRSQIVEYMKYRAPVALGEEFLEKINAFKSFKKQSEILSSKLEIDRNLDKVRKQLEELSKNIELVNTYDAKVVEEKITDICKLVAQKIVKEKECEELKEKVSEKKKEKEDYIKSEAYKKELESLTNKLKAAKEESEIESIREEINNLTKPYDDEIEKAENNYEDARDIVSDLEKSVKIFVEDLTDYVEKFYDYNKAASDCTEKYRLLCESIEDKDIKNIKEKLQGDNSEFAEKMRLEIAKVEKLLSKKSILALKDKFDSNKNMLRDGDGNLLQKLKDIKFEKIDSSYKELSGLKKEDTEKIINCIKKDIVNADALIKNYVKKYKTVTKSEFETTKKASSDKKIEDPRKATKKVMDSSENPLNELKETKEHKDFKDKLAILPSGEGKVSSEMILKSFLGEDYDFVSKVLEDEAKMDDTEAKDVVNGLDFNNSNNENPDKGFALVSNLISVLEKGLEGLRDEIYVGEYALGMFNNYLTNKDLKQEQGNKISKTDLTGRPRSERKPYLYFENEIEYILGGHSDDNLNVYNVMAKILLIRFVLNTVYIYTDPEKSKEALVAAEILAGWTGFGVPIVQTLIMLSWSMAESVLDVKCLISGKSVPIYKTSDTWQLSAKGGLEKLQEKIQNTLMEGVQEYSKKIANYGIDKAEDAAKAAIENLNDTINAKVDNVVEKLFAPIENALDSADKVIKDNYNEITNSLEQQLSDVENSLMNDLIKEIYKQAKAEYDSIKTEVENYLTLPIEKAKEEIENQKQMIKDTVNDKLSTIKDRINAEINEAAKKGKEAVNEYIDSFSSEKTSNAYTNIKASILSLNYEEYLRLLLLLMPNREKKITRIQDLIQLQMSKMTGNESFRISDCNIYVAVKVQTSMRYFFMSQNFVKKELKIDGANRHKLEVTLLKGY